MENLPQKFVEIPGIDDSFIQIQADQGYRIQQVFERDGRLWALMQLIES